MSGKIESGRTTPTRVPNYTTGGQCSLTDAVVTGHGLYVPTYTCSCGTVTAVQIRLLASGVPAVLDYADGGFSDDPHDINCWNLAVLWALRGSEGLAAFLSALWAGQEWESAFTAAADGTSAGSETAEETPRG